MTHTETEDQPWGIFIPDHVRRSDSGPFKKARAWVNGILADVTNWFFGAPPYQAHHGGSLWLKDDQGWFMVKNIAGSEWSAQFCGDPARYELLRLNAVRLYKMFPQALQEMDAAGLNATEILNTPITDAAGIALWTDSVFNSCVPLRAPEHTGVLPQGGGCHHYPTPITDIQFLKQADFNLWVKDPHSHRQVAVVPVAERGSGDGRVEVVFSAPGTKLAEQHMAAAKANMPLILDADHPLAKQAFANQ